MLVIFAWRDEMDGDRGFARYDLNEGLLPYWPKLFLEVRDDLLSDRLRGSAARVPGFSSGTTAPLDRRYSAIFIFSFASAQLNGVKTTFSSSNHGNRRLMSAPCSTRSLTNSRADSSGSTLIAVRIALLTFGSSRSG